jgi:deoxyribodipyrimidine photolyase-related protein
VGVEFKGIPVIAAAPSSYRMSQNLEDFGVEFVENDFFLTLRGDFRLWAEAQKSFVMENFYRKQRVRLSILMDGATPEGGAWNFDKENRLPPPKQYDWPPYLHHQLDDIDREVAAELQMTPTGDWGTTRAAALLQLEHFLKYSFAGFGPLEDAIPSDNWAVHHSLLSPYLNIGLIHPQEVIAAALVRFGQGGIPIASCEAFVRQIIGWREYINGMYWFLGEDYRNHNQLGANRKLLPLFEDPSKTQMNCMKSVVTDVQTRSWVHHIPRLMVLSNLALLTGTNPQEYLNWMREQFIDANDWVMVPNVIGMATHADGGIMMTKPYGSGGAYISKMTQYCKPCVYDPKKRVGEDACPFTTLYWDFLARHREQFRSNHRMAQQFAGLSRLSDLPELQVRAVEILDGLSAGTI